MSKVARTALKSRGFILQQCGAFTAMGVFPFLAVRYGRRPAFLAAMICGWAAILITFSSLHHPWQVKYLYPLLGFGTLAPFGLYAVYFPELFPTRLRTTGTGMCYNTARYAAAFGPPALAAFSSALEGKTSMPGFRLAAMIVSSCYLLGIVAAIFAPETRGRPLPEDEPLAPLPPARGFEVKAAR
jgi:MFS family permease